MLAVSVQNDEQPASSVVAVGAGDFVHHQPAFDLRAHLLDGRRFPRHRIRADRNGQRRHRNHQEPHRPAQHVAGLRPLRSPRRRRAQSRLRRETHRRHGQMGTIQVAHSY